MTKEAHAAPPLSFSAPFAHKRRVLALLGTTKEVVMTFVRNNDCLSSCCVFFPVILNVREGGVNYAIKKAVITAFFILCFPI